MNHPKGLTVDERGNIYVADTVNTTIRKISDAGVVILAGGKWGKGGGLVNGPSEDAKFSSDFDVVYLGSRCSLLVIDRGYKEIREIQLPFDDCAYQYESGFPLGIDVLIAAGFFDYMLELLQRRIGSIVSSQSDQGETETRHTSGPYQKPLMSSLKPPLIPTEDEQEKQEGFLGYLGKLLSSAGASAVEILGGIFPGNMKKHQDYQFPEHIHLCPRMLKRWNSLYKAAKFTVAGMTNFSSNNSQCRHRKYNSINIVTSHPPLTLTMSRVERKQLRLCLELFRNKTSSKKP